MGLTLANLRAETLAEAGIDATDLDASGTTNLDLLINQSWWEVMDKLDFNEKKGNTTFATVAGTREYDLAAKILASAAVTFEAFQSLFIKDPDTLDHIQLDEWSIPKYESEYNEDTTMRDFPTAFARREGWIRLNPVPDDVYTLTVYFLKTLSDVPSNGPTVPQAWHEIIKYGAVWRLHHRYRDYNSAREVKQTQMDLIASAQTTQGKEDVSKNNIGVEVPVRPTSRRY